jgi:hypothetical protein
MHSRTAAMQASTSSALTWMIGTSKPSRGPTRSASIAESLGWVVKPSWLFADQVDRAAVV